MEIIGISADPAERNLAWSRELELPFRLLSDVDGRVARQWGVWDDTWNLTHRATFVVDRNRRIRWLDAGSLALDVSRTLDAVTRLARAR